MRITSFLKRLSPIGAAVLILIMVVMLYPVVPPKPQEVHAATRLGLHVTQEELDIWRQRAANGPYKTIGDVSTNSPGDWNRIVQNKETFRANPNSQYPNGDYWAGGNWSTTSCVPEHPTWYEDWQTHWPAKTDWIFGDRVRDAAFFAMVLPNDPTSADAAAKVRTFLLTQAQTPTADFRNKQMLCDGVITGDGGVMLGLNPWIIKLLSAYDYLLIRGGVITSADRAILDPWFLEAARFIRATMFGAAPNFTGNFASIAFPTAEAEFDTTVRQGKLYSRLQPPFNECPMNGGKDPRALYDQGPQVSAYWALGSSNRGMTQIAYMAQAGVMFNDASLIRHVKMNLMTWLTYYAWPDGADPELTRVYDSNMADEDQGYQYMGVKLAAVVEAVDVLARAGDLELYNYSTSAGVCQINQSNAGGPKSLRTMIDAHAQYVDHTLTRYCPGCPRDLTHQIDLIRRKPSAGTSCGRNHDVFMLPIANRFYNTTYLKNIYMRQPTGGPSNPPNYPSDATICGVGFYSWGGAWGKFPGVLFMFGQMEGKVWPYSSTSPTPTPTTGPTAHWKLDETSGTAASDSSGNANHATLANGPAWMPSGGKIAGALSFDGVNDEMTVSNASNKVLPATNESFSLAFWMNPRTTASSDNIRSLMTNESYTASGFRLGMDQNNKILFWSTESGGSAEVLSSTALSLNQWAHVAVTFDKTAGTARVYVNGALAGSDSTSTILSNTNTLKIAGAIGGKQFFDGLLDDIRIYNRALAESEIQTLANPATPTPTPTPTPGPVACHLYTPSSQIPSGFGVPWDVFSGMQEMLIKATCQNATDATLDFGRGVSTQYIYNTGYHYHTGLSGWMPMTLTSAETLISGAWYPKTATATLTGLDLTNTTHYALGYLCTWNGTQWKCGCRDAACTQSYWQIQSFKR